LPDAEVPTEIACQFEETFVRNFVNEGEPGPPDFDTLFELMKVAGQGDLSGNFREEWGLGTIRSERPHLVQLFHQEELGAFIEQVSKLKSPVTLLANQGSFPNSFLAHSMSIPQSASLGFRYSYTNRFRKAK
jgi:hypothetical protein